jgi:16S rRNA (guanine527-N7)-methyltransferase
VDEIQKSLHEQFSQLAPQLDFAVSSAQQEQLIAYVMLLHKWNKTYNLSSVRQASEMLVKHIFDSIVVTPHLQGTNVADVGTGPGLPGIPLAIMCPEKSFTLIDSLGKRVTFMKQAVHSLQLKNVFPIHARVEDVVAEKPFDAVLSRAFASLNDMLLWCSHLSQKDGLFLALKGQLHRQELNQIPPQFTLVQSIPLLIPSLIGERHLVIIKKSSA